MQGWRRTVPVVAVLVLVAVAGVLGLGSRDGGQQRPRLDVQAHRGGLGLRPESSAGAFAHALELGVTTLELDVQITADGQPVVTHDRRVNPVVCRDTAPVAVGDRAFPYVGKLGQGPECGAAEDVGVRQPPPG